MRRIFESLNSYLCLRFPSRAPQPHATRWYRVRVSTSVQEPSQHRKRGKSMHDDSHIANAPAQIVRSTPNSPYWLVLCVSLCGALAGGSIVEAIALLASHSSMPVSWEHLVTEPLIVAGALCGGLLAAVLASGNHSKLHQTSENGADPIALLDAVPAEPTAWQPTPPMLRAIQPAMPISQRPTRSSPQHAFVIRRTGGGRIGRSMTRAHIRRSGTARPRRG